MLTPSKEAERCDNGQLLRKHELCQNCDVGRDHFHPAFPPRVTSGYLLSISWKLALCHSSEQLDVFKYLVGRTLAWYDVHHCHNKIPLENRTQTYEFIGLHCCCFTTFNPQVGHILQVYLFRMCCSSSASSTRIRCDLLSFVMWIISVERSTAHYVRAGFELFRVRISKI